MKRTHITTSTYEKKLLLQTLALVLLFVVCCAMAIFFCQHPEMAWSFALGGVTYLSLSMLSVFLLFKETYASAAIRIVRRFYSAELIKLIITVVVFAVFMKEVLFTVLTKVLGYSLGLLIGEVAFWFIFLIALKMSTSKGLQSEGVIT